MLPLWQDVPLNVVIYGDNIEEKGGNNQKGMLLYLIKKFNIKQLLGGKCEKIE